MSRKHDGWARRHTPISARIPIIMYRAFASACKVSHVGQKDVVLPVIRQKIIDVWGQERMDEVDRLVEEERLESNRRAKQRHEDYLNTIRKNPK